MNPDALFPLANALPLPICVWVALPHSALSKRLADALWLGAFWPPFMPSAS